MKENPIEQRLRDKLTAHGFKVLKLTCPGTIGVLDRLILAPKWSPGPPWVVECKATGKTERRAQELIAIEWRERGVQVLARCDSYERVDEIVAYLLAVCMKDIIP